MLRRVAPLVGVWLVALLVSTHFDTSASNYLLTGILIGMLL